MEVERTFGRCARPSKPQSMHLSNYGRRVIELTTNHIDKRRTRTASEWIRQSRVEPGNDCTLSR